MVAVTLSTLVPMNYMAHTIATNCSYANNHFTMVEVSTDESQT
jgi:hypothetical protein